MKLGIIGRVALNVDLYDGQTVKTRNVYSLLKKMDSDVVVVDTYQYKKRIIKVLLQTLACLRKCDKIIVCLSINGRKFFFPFLYYANKLFRKEIYHSLIGGRLAKNIEEYPSWKKYVNSFAINWVESRELVEELAKLNVHNAEYMPNFKTISALKEEELICANEKTYSFCTFSRVQEQKGITDAIEAIQEINVQYGAGTAMLDIYGPIDREFEKSFQLLLDQHKEYIKYKGCVDAEQSVSVVKNYHMLLFPTRYFNEGIPGTIIDALCAGVPIIARRWHYCDEMIVHNKTGFVYEFNEPEQLVNCIRSAVEHPEHVYEMKRNCLEKAKEYLAESVFKQMQERFYH